MKADLHIHSFFSNGDSSPERIVDIAIERGINCICIADHEEVKGAIRAMKFAFDKNILVVPGIEVFTASGEILGINVKEAIPKGLSPEKTIEEIRRQGGLVSIPHPFHWPNNHFRGGEKRIISLKPDAVEVFNGSAVYRYANQKALDFAKRNNISFTAGSDAHRLEFVGRAYIETLKDFSSAQELLDEIKGNRVKIGGERLNKWEVFKNFSGTDAGKLLKFCSSNFKK